MQPERLPVVMARGTKEWKLYLLLNARANRWYVGQTSSGLARIRSHFKTSTANPILYSDVEQYGIEAFRYRFLAPVYPTKEAATLAELIEIVRRDTVFPRGYNRSIETAPFMTQKTWDKLRQVAEKSRGFVDDGEMLDVSDL